MGKQQWSGFILLALVWSISLRQVDSARALLQTSSTTSPWLRFPNLLPPISQPTLPKFNFTLPPISLQQPSPLTPSIPTSIPPSTLPIWPTFPWTNLSPPPPSFPWTNLSPPPPSFTFPWTNPLSPPPPSFPWSFPSPPPPAIPWTNLTTPLPTLPLLPWNLPTPPPPSFLWNIPSPPPQTNPLFPWLTPSPPPPAFPWTNVTNPLPLIPTLPWNSPAPPPPSVTSFPWITPSPPPNSALFPWTTPSPPALSFPWNNPSPPPSLNFPWLTSPPPTTPPSLLPWLNASPPPAWSSSPLPAFGLPPGSPLFPTGIQFTFANFTQTWLPDAGVKVTWQSVISVELSLQLFAEALMKPITLVLSAVQGTDSSPASWGWKNGLTASKLQANVGALCTTSGKDGFPVKGIVVAHTPIDDTVSTAITWFTVLFSGWSKDTPPEAALDHTPGTFGGFVTNSTVNNLKSFCSNPGALNRIATKQGQYVLNK